MCISWSSLIYDTTLSYIPISIFVEGDRKRTHWRTTSRSKIEFWTLIGSIDNLMNIELKEKDIVDDQAILEQQTVEEIAIPVS